MGTVKITWQPVSVRVTKLIVVLTAEMLIIYSQDVWVLHLGVQRESPGLKERIITRSA